MSTRSSRDDSGYLGPVEPRPVTYLVGSPEEGYTFVTYGVDGGTSRVYYPPASTDSPSKGPVEMVLDPDRPRFVEEFDVDGF